MVLKRSQRTVAKADEKYKPTQGCVAILKKDFLKILPAISKNTKISIS